ncbi:MAG: hypothetical protein P4L31_07305 [Candidatus Babeliales bacterium]|nr:hypothetical protein [Candidatus Babeliales bacterium]
MKKDLITFLAVIALMALCGLASAQFPKTHIYYDTTKTVSKRIEYLPDTIPVFFKEIAVDSFKTHEIYKGVDTTYWTLAIREHFGKGFVIWQTYKQKKTIIWSYSSSAYLSGTTDITYYKDSYEPTKSLPGIFLYEDKKTRVKNIVTISILR